MRAHHHASFWKNPGGAALTAWLSATIYNLLIDGGQHEQK